MKVLLSLFVMSFGLPAGVLENLAEARTLLEDVTAREQLSRAALQRSHCVVVFAGSGADGIATCRTGLRSWSGPAVVQAEGAAIPPDTIIVLPRRDSERLMSRSGSDTAVSLTAYTRSGGKVAASEIDSAVFAPATGVNRELYGAATLRDILTGRVTPPNSVRPFVTWMVGQGSPDPKRSRKPSAFSGDGTRSRGK